MSTKQSKLVLFVQQYSTLIGLFIAILSVSTASILIRKAQETLPSLVIAAYRLLLSSLFLLPFTIKKVIEEKHALNRSNLLLLFGSGLLLALHFTSWIKSLEYTNVVSSVVLVTTTPVWVTLFSPIFLKERQSRAFSTGLAMAVLGIIIISFSGVCQLSASGIQCMDTTNLGEAKGLTGNLLALMGAWCMAGYTMVGRKVRKELSNWSYIFLVYSVTALILLLLCLITHQPLLKVTGQDLLWLGALALIPQTIGHSLLNWALGKLPAAYVSLSLLGEPVGSAALAYLFLNERPTALEWLGAGVIIFGIYWASKPHKRADQSDVML